jgi:hypothetical protein
LSQTRIPPRALADSVIHSDRWIIMTSESIEIEHGSVVSCDDAPQVEKSAQGDGVLNKRDRLSSIRPKENI